MTPGDLVEGVVPPTGTAWARIHDHGTFELELVLDPEAAALRRDPVDADELTRRSQLLDVGGSDSAETDAEEPDADAGTTAAVSGDAGPS